MTSDRMDGETSRDDSAPSGVDNTTSGVDNTTSRTDSITSLPNPFSAPFWRLPLELRRQIYGHVFSPIHDIDDGASVSCWLSLSILATCRQINLEAYDIFRKETLLVQLVSSLAPLEIRRSAVRFGFRTLYNGTNLPASFPSAVLGITAHWANARRASPPTNTMLLWDDFRACCHALRFLETCAPITLNARLLDIFKCCEDRHGIVGVQAASTSTFFNPDRQRKLLRPIMEHIDDHEDFRLDGDIDGSVRAECESIVRAPRWASYEEMITFAEARTDEGARHFQDGHMALALSVWNDATLIPDLWHARWMRRHGFPSRGDHELNRTDWHLIQTYLELTRGLLEQRRLAKTAQKNATLYYSVDSGIEHWIRLGRRQGRQTEDLDYFKAGSWLYSLEGDICALPNIYGQSDVLGQTLNAWESARALGSDDMATVTKEMERLGVWI